MIPWSIAVLLSKRLKHGDIELLVVPVFVHATDKDAAMNRAQEIAATPGYDVRGCSFVEAADGARSEGLTWWVGAWVTMP